MEELFEKVGEVDTIEIIHDCRGRSKGVAFVTFEYEKDAEKPAKIYVKILTGKRFELSANPYNRIEDVKEMIQDKEGLPPDQLPLFFKGQMLENGKQLRDYSIGNKSTILLLLRLTGGKPVIYLYPEKDDFDVSVNVSMKPEDGEITSIYLEIDIFWFHTDINANINRKHYYLFWECLFNESFNIDEGFVIKGDQCYQFFEEKLQFFGFKDNEANDYITYWCPRMEHSKYVLINFQGEDYDRRAPLKIEPKPDRIIRIFMTFKLLDEFISIPIQDIEKFNPFFMWMAAATSTSTLL